MTSKKYSYAAAQCYNDHLLTTFREESSKYNSQVIASIFNQLLIKATTKQWDCEVAKAIKNEMKQFHWPNSFQPIHWIMICLLNNDFRFLNHMFLCRGREQGQ